MAIAPYIQRLRTLVGHELLVLPGAAALPRDEQGRILLVRITDTSQWAAIGGAIEPDESPQQAAIREAEEEAGVILDSAAYWRARRSRVPDALPQRRPDVICDDGVRRHRGRRLPGPDGEETARCDGGPPTTCPTTR